MTSPKTEPSVTAEKLPLGEAPAILAKRYLVKPNTWCPKPDIEFDAACDPDNPKAVMYKEVCAATKIVKMEIPKTPLLKSKCCLQFGMELHFKFEIFHKTGSFHERSAFYILNKLNYEQKNDGVYTASMGNWGMALAYYGHLLNVSVTVVLPTQTLYDTVEKCRSFGAIVILKGNNFAEAKRHAFALIAEKGAGYYLNGYDHPHVIAAAGSIGIEILEQLPKTEAILVPVGGGALIAGIATAVKQIKPTVLIYGVESDKNCCFFKAMENEGPYQTATMPSLANSLAIPTAGYNAFHTARSFIDKMVLVDEDWITTAFLYLVEEEKFITEGAGAISLSALMAVPNILPELQDKTVVCVITGGNIDNYTLPRVIERAKEIDGRIIKITVKINNNDTKLRHKVLSVMYNVGCNILNCYTEKHWMYENDIENTYVTFICDTQNLKHACSLKRVMTKIFPGICEFLEEPFSPIPFCSCFPNRNTFFP